MSFSVLLSLYYKENPEYLRQSLDSIFRQSLLPDEIILMEDGPVTDELEDIVAEFSSKYDSLKIVRLPQNGGLGHALNEGLKYCSNDIIARMDTDDISKPDRFKKQIKIFEDHPEIDVCSSWIDEFCDNTDNVISVKIIPQNHDEIYDFGKNRCPVNHPAVMYRKNAVLDCGGYGPFPEDYYLWGKMLKNGKRFYNIQESLLFFRSSPDVYRRRGGWQYCKSMGKLQIFLYRIRYITLFTLAKNLLIRSSISLLPNSIREIFYNRFLRKSVKV